MLNTGYSPWPSYSEEEVSAVSNVLRSNRVNYWTGEECRTFEREFAQWTGSNHAISVFNGTVAIDLALKALGLKPGDEVVVTPRSFMASASCVVWGSGVPVFADVDLDSQNVTAQSIEAVITPRTRGIICVHLAGWPCDMRAILSVADKYGLWVIEDCAQAHGASIDGVPVGSMGHVGAWSFCQDKIMTTGGEGGMVTTSDPALWEKMWSLKDHGKSWSAMHGQAHPPGFRWVHEGFGTNWRMTEIQAAIGRIQLKKMAVWSRARSNNARRLADAMRGFSAVRVPMPPDSFRHAYYRQYAFVKPEDLREGWSRDRIILELTARGVPCFQGSCPEIYREKAFVDAGLAPSEYLPNARRLGETSLMFLVHPTLTADEMDRIVAPLQSVLREASSI